jgi:HEAT repeat protein
MELVTALKDCPSTEALGLLQSLVADSDRTIRRQAVEAIVARSGSTAFETIGALIDDESLPSLDHDDQQALLNAYSLLGGEQAVAYLSQMILRYNPLRDARLVFCRTAAFEALSFNASERGERMLVRLSSSWRPDIRKQAAYALQRRRENIFGQEV